MWLLSRQTYDNFEALILDDGSDEKISQLCGGKIIYEKVRGPGSRPRASNMAWNHGYRLCDGEFIILGHPEYMMPLDAISRLVEKYDGSARLEPVALAIPALAMHKLNEVNWQKNLGVLNTLPEFWTAVTPWGWTNKEAASWCHHFAFTGQTREAWDVTDFIPETTERHMNDSWMVKVEVEMGRPPMCADFAVYHQHHERTTEWPFKEKSVRIKRIQGIDQ